MPGHRLYPLAPSLSYADCLSLSSLFIYLLTSLCVCKCLWQIMVTLRVNLKQALKRIEWAKSGPQRVNQLTDDCRHVRATFTHCQLLDTPPQTSTTHFFRGAGNEK